MDQWGSERIPGLGWCLAVIAVSVIAIWGASAYYFVVLP